MTPSPGARERAVPFVGLLGLLLGLLVVFASISSLSAPIALAAGWTPLERVTDARASRLDSLHQLSADRGQLHLVHPSTGPGSSDDRVLYQRSEDAGASWNRPFTLFESTPVLRDVVPNLAVAARGGVVAAAWRVSGPDGHTLFVRVSRDGGDDFAGREALFTTEYPDGIGVPAVAVAAAGKVVSVAWTDRARGRVRVRTSRDAGRTFADARTVARTKMSIDCRERVLDGLVGLAASKASLHLAWSQAPKGRCQASSIRLRTSGNDGRSWRPAVEVTSRRTYGWPELEARGRTVLATVQSTTGGVVLARSADGGASWRQRLLKAPKGFSFSAADSTLIDGGKAMLTYVKERLRSSRLMGTAVLSRWSPDDGSSLRRPKTVVPDAAQLRMAPNIASVGRSLTIVVQSGPLSGSPRNVFVTRLR